MLDVGGILYYSKLVEYAQIKLFMTPQAPAFVGFSRDPRPHLNHLFLPFSYFYLFICIIIIIIVLCVEKELG